jgi:mono/diheme cytochrome c family protein
MTRNDYIPVPRAPDRNFQSLEICPPQTSSHWKSAGLCAAMIAGLFAITGCGLRQAMFDQPKVARPMQESTFFADGMASRPLIEGAVPWTPLPLSEDPLLNDGRIADATGTNIVDATVFPFPITPADLARGQERFNIYCAPCHDQAGTGNGMIVKRGFKQPPTYHQDRLRTAPPGYFYNVIKNGFGQMPGYAPQVPVDDRWRIAAYIRTLQFSQNADKADLPPQLQAQLK